MEFFHTFFVFLWPIFKKCSYSAIHQEHSSLEANLHHTGINHNMQICRYIHLRINLNFERVITKDTCSTTFRHTQRKFLTTTTTLQDWTNEQLTKDFEWSDVSQKCILRDREYIALLEVARDKFDEPLWVWKCVVYELSCLWISYHLCVFSNSTFPKPSCGQAKEMYSTNLLKFLFGSQRERSPSLIKKSAEIFVDECSIN